MRSGPRQPLSLSAPRLGRGPAPVPATGEVCPLLRGQTTGSHCWAAARPGGGILSPQAPLCRALGTPPRPQVPAPAKGCSKQVSSFSPPDPPAAERPATHTAGLLHPQSPAQTFPPAAALGPRSLPFLPSWGPSGVGPQHLVRERSRGGGARSRNGTDRSPDHPAESAGAPEQGQQRRVLRQTPTSGLGPRASHPEHGLRRVLRVLSDGHRSAKTSPFLW